MSHRSVSLAVGIWSMHQFLDATRIDWIAAIFLIVSALSLTWFVHSMEQR